MYPCLLSEKIIWAFSTNTNPDLLVEHAYCSSTALPRYASRHPTTDFPLDVDPRQKWTQYRRAAGEHGHHNERYLQAFHVRRNDAGQDIGVKVASEFCGADSNHLGWVDAWNILLQAVDELVCEQCLASRDKDSAAHGLEDYRKLVNVCI